MTKKQSTFSLFLFKSMLTFGVAVPTHCRHCLQQQILDSRILFTSCSAHVMPHVTARQTALEKLTVCSNNLK